jgi:murein DD-endopeptidase MepM/ murein hydrolase activator NlpD
MRWALLALIMGFTASVGASARPLSPKRLALFETTPSKTSTYAPDPVCPDGMFPDGDACVHLPADVDEGEDAPVLANAHRERSGRWAIYDQIPRRPDRPADYDLYRYPIPSGLFNGKTVASGYDLDRPDESQRRGWRIRAVGHGAVDLPAPRGTPIALLELTHQQGNADVVYVGPLVGNTVVTRHTLREGGQLRDYILVFGHLDAAAPGLAAGAELHEGDRVGFVGDSGSPELVHLHLEVRRVRDGVDVKKKPPGQLLEGTVSVVCDPRNVLPLK